MSSTTHNTETSHNPTYRADIDGLRALAIIAVVLFHAFPGHFPGGFVGVDVFFVISGFLISSILFRALEQGSFSFLDFYARRVRRLFPALSVVLVSVLLFGWLALTGDEFKLLGKHAAAGAGFVQNFVLWGEAGYFDTSSDLKPLLHLWSLAIEEQYYLFFPLLVWLAWRWRINLFIVIALIAVASFGFNLATVRDNPLATFYLPHTRIWELMAGALLAWWMSRQQASENHAFTLQPSLKKSLLSLLGFTFILVATFVFAKHHHYPGWRALIPVVGTVLLIYAGAQAWLNRTILSARVVVFIGLISYPLYLWHWPLLSFARIIESEPLSHWYLTVLISVSVLLAVCTYLLIERPIRFGRRSGAVTLALVVMMMGIGATGFLAHTRDITSRMEMDVQELQRWESLNPIYEKNCAELFPDWNGRERGFNCSTLAPGAPDIAVIGDSHAKRIHYGITHYLSEDYNIGLFPIGCAMPFYDISVGIPPKHRKPGYTYPKTKLINDALNFSINDPAVKLVVLATGACWHNIVDTTNLNEKRAGIIVEQKMFHTFDWLSKSGKEVIYVLDNPILDFDPKDCISRPFRINSSQSSCKIKRDLVANQRVEYFEIARRLLSLFPKIKVFDVAKELCDDEYCYAVIDNKLLYHDHTHLSHEGSKRVGAAMLPMLQEALAGAGAGAKSRTD